MRTFLPVLFFSLFSAAILHAQLTLVRSGPTETLNMICPDCATQVTGLALTKGQHSIPANLQKPVSLNLLHWQYYDDIVKKNIVTESEPTWTEHSQLFDTVSATTPLSLHINLAFKDSTGRQYQIFIVLAGATKPQLLDLPAAFHFDADTYAQLRFGALAQVAASEGKKETYDAVEGTCTLDFFDPKTLSLSGTFEFTGNRIGMAKRCYFKDGIFAK